MPHSTNYFDTFICVAPDSTSEEGSAPPSRKSPSVAERTYALLNDAAYALTSDEVVFAVFAARKGIEESERDEAREAFFAKPQPCLRCSDLGKRYGWGLHFDRAGKIAIYGLGTSAYAQLASGTDLEGRPVKVKHAMRSTRCPAEAKAKGS